MIGWHHPDFPIGCIHPRWGDADAFEQKQGRDMKKYVQYMRDQVTKLLSNYGKIDIPWLDYCYDNSPDAKPWMKGKGKDEWEACQTFSGA